MHYNYTATIPSLSLDSNARSRLRFSTLIFTINPVYCFRKFSISAGSGHFQVFVGSVVALLHVLQFLLTGWRFLSTNCAMLEKATSNEVGGKKSYSGLLQPQVIAKR